MKEATHFYTELYTCKNLQHNDMDTFLDEIGETKKLNAVDKNSCESEITLEDYEYAISTLCDNKSPGNDGLTAEFYKTFSTTFSQFLVGVYNESFNMESFADHKENPC